MSQNNQQGNILLLSLLMAGLFVAAALPLSFLITSSMQQGRISDDSMQAWYQAEIGIEQGLYQWRQLNRDPEPASNWQSDLTVEGQSLKQELTLEPNTTVSLPAYGNYGLTVESNTNHPFGAVGVSAIAASSGTLLAVQWSTWQPSSAYPDNAAAQEIVVPATNFLNQTDTLAIPAATGLDEGQPILYHLVFRPLYGDVSNLKITLHGSVGGPAFDNVPVLLKLKSSGISGRSGQTITATALRRAPAYGLFDYVLFTEGDLTK